MNQLTLLVILMALGISCQCTSIVPSFLNICYRDDIHLNECIAQSVEALKPFLRKGIPEFHIPICEPLEISEMKFDEATGPAFVVSTYTNIIIEGGTRFTIKNINVDMKKNDIEFNLFIPQLSMTANYDLDGKILLLPIKSNGITNGNFSEIKADVKIDGETYENTNTNQTHFRVANFSVILNIGHGQIHLGNLFNSDEKFSNAMNRFVNENWKIITTELKPALEIKIGEALKKFANEIFMKFPLDLLLPPSKGFTRHHHYDI